MLVYRVCDEEEINIIFALNSTDYIGRNFLPDSKANNHNYKKDVKYIHFFEKFEDIFYLNSDVNSYVCIYDIDDNILLKSKGEGYYLDRINLRDLQSVVEYAVDINDISFDNLVQVEKIFGSIDFEDYVNNDYQDNIEIIYSNNNNNNNKILRR